MSGKEKPLVTIVADRAEVRGGVPKLLQTVHGTEVTIAELDIGDYILGDLCVVERKEANDFAVSIMDGRLMSQAVMLAANCQRPVVIVEGSLSGIRSGIAPASIAGALSHLSVGLGITVLHTDDTQGTALLLATMARHLQHGLGYEVPLRVAKPTDLAALQQYVVEGMPGVGAKTAKALLAEKGSVAEIMAMDERGWRQVKGLGTAKADRIFQVLHGRYAGAPPPRYEIGANPPRALTEKALRQLERAKPSKKGAELLAKAATATVKGFKK